MDQEDFSKYNGEGTTLRKAQLRMLDILIEVDKICRKHNIPYWLDFGTLLGAIRHKGFIPWDDDIDIAVVKKDYKKLKKVLKDELPMQYTFQDWSSEKNLITKMGKVRDSKSYYKEFYYDKEALICQGIYIDIFPKVKIVSLKVRKFIDFFYGRAYKRLHGFNDNLLEKIIAWTMWPFVNLLVFFANNCSTLIRYLTKNNRISDIYGSVSLYSKHNLDDIFPLKEYIFEEKFFLVPNQWDKYLKEIYGDYMEIPPVEKRQIHAEKIELF